MIRMKSMFRPALAAALGICWAVAFAASSEPARRPGGDGAAAQSASKPALKGKVPGQTWEVARKPEDLGFSSEKLAAAQAFSKTLKTAAVMVVVHGVVVDQWGDVAKKYLTHSTRKSFLSAIYGKYVQSGVIDLEKTLADLGIDDEPPLTAAEKQATVRDCLKARSGVFHTAEAENDAMHAMKPARGTYKPSEFWLYNNWDFNVLGTIFEKLTGKTVFQGIYDDLAVPLKMEDFKPEDGEAFTTGRSKHAAYMFVVSARDMARLGLLMLRGGDWNGTQVIPRDWVKESTTYFSDATIYKGDGYGYMWWIAKDHNKFPHFPNARVPEGSFSARGAGGHYIVVIPDYDMVVVHRVDTFGENSVGSGDFGKLLGMILEARIR
jgi:CubicO group peptidase (beta-lactamase class C family)